jgi:hypothetical protein
MFRESIKFIKEEVISWFIYFIISFIAVFVITGVNIKITFLITLIIKVLDYLLKIFALLLNLYQNKVESAVIEKALFFNEFIIFALLLTFIITSGIILRFIYKFMGISYFQIFEAFIFIFVLKLVIQLFSDFLNDFLKNSKNI